MVEASNDWWIVEQNGSSNTTDSWSVLVMDAVGAFGGPIVVGPPQSCGKLPALLLVKLGFNLLSGGFMKNAFLLKDISPKWFYMWQVMIPIGIFVEIISFFFIHTITGYGLMAALFGVSGKWLRNQNIMIKMLFGITFWFIGGILRFELFNHF